MEETRGFKPYPYQIPYAWAIIDSVMSGQGREILAEWGRKMGKTEINSAVPYFLASTINTIYFSPLFKNGFACEVFAPKKEQADIDFQRIKDYYERGVAKDLFGIDFEICNGKMIKLSNGNYISASTASPKTNIEGPDLNLIIVEEAQAIDNLRLRKSILPMGAANNATRVLSGTATNETGGTESYFYHALKKAKARDKFIYDCTEGFKYNYNYEVYVTDLINKLGEDSEEIRSQFFLEWPKDRRMLFNRDELEACRTSQTIPVYRMSPVGVGIDVGKFNDSTIVTVGDFNYRILNWYEIENNISYVVQARMIKENFLRNYNIFNIVVEENGQGAVFIDILDEFHVKVQSWWNEPKEKEALSNQLVKLVGERRLSYPANSTKERYRFEEQLLNLRRVYRMGHMYAEALKKNKHDDYYTSLLMMIKALERKKELNTDISISVNKRTSHGPTTALQQGFPKKHYAF